MVVYYLNSIYFSKSLSRIKRSSSLETEWVIAVWELKKIGFLRLAREWTDDNFEILDLRVQQYVKTMVFNPNTFVDTPRLGGKCVNGQTILINAYRFQQTSFRSNGNRPMILILLFFFVVGIDDQPCMYNNNKNPYRAQ